MYDNDQLLDLGSVVRVTNEGVIFAEGLSGPTLAIIVDGGSATPFDYVLAVQGMDDLVHVAWTEVEYIRPSYLAEITLYDDEPGAVLFRHLWMLGREMCRKGGCKDPISHLTEEHRILENPCRACGVDAGEVCISLCEFFH